MKTLVLGASEKTDRYSNRAMKMLKSFGHEVLALGLKEGEVDGIKIQKGEIPFENVHTVTLYLGPDNQKPWYDYIVNLKPHRVIFNPGTENEELTDKLHAANIKSIEACTLVMLSVGNYED